MNRRVAVRAIIVKDGQLLCVRQKHYEGGIISDTNFWCTPGGGVNDGEALVPALRREIIEELGPEPEIGQLIYIQQFTHNSTEHLEFFFHVLNADDYVDLDLSRTTHGAVEIAEVKFNNPANVPVLPEFLATEQFDTISTKPTAPKIFSYLT